MFNFLLKKTQNKADSEEESDGNIKTVAEESESEPKISKANINRYNDPEGLTVQRMGIGFWLVSNRKRFILAFQGFLILIGVITWPLFIWTFGHYLIFGIRQDRELAYEIVNTGVITHETITGLMAKPLKYSLPYFFEGDDGEYDIAAEVRNPNDKYGAKIQYYFETSQGNTKIETGFILPGETKYLFVLGQNFNSNPQGGRLVIESPSWHRVDPRLIPNWELFRSQHLDIKIEDPIFVPAKSTTLTEKLNLNNISFTVINNSAYNYYQAGFSLHLMRAGMLVGINRIAINNFMSGETRAVGLVWPGRFGRVDEMIVKPDIDIMRDDIYVKF